MFGTGDAARVESSYITTRRTAIGDECSLLPKGITFKQNVNKLKFKGLGKDQALSNQY